MSVNNLLGIITSLGVFAIFLFVVLIAVLIAAYVFSSLGIMGLAKKNDLPAPWLAFIPGGRSYLIGKLGYEIYVEPSKRNQTLTWVTLGLGIGALVFDINNYLLGNMLTIALTVFQTVAFYNIFKVINEKNCVIYTVVTAIYNNLGGIFLYLNRDKAEKREIAPLEISEEVNEDLSSEEKQTETKPTIEHNFCIHCGAKLKPNSKFCGECGKAIK